MLKFFSRYLLAHVKHFLQVYLASSVHPVFPCVTDVHQLDTLTVKSQGTDRTGCRFWFGCHQSLRMEQWERGGDGPWGIEFQIQGESLLVENEPGSRNEQIERKIITSQKPAERNISKQNKTKTKRSLEL